MCVSPALPGKSERKLATASEGFFRFVLPAAFTIDWWLEPQCQGLMSNLAWCFDTQDWCADFKSCRHLAGILSGQHSLHTCGSPLFQGDRQGSGVHAALAALAGSPPSLLRL